MLIIVSFEKQNEYSESKQSTQFCSVLFAVTIYLLQMVLMIPDPLSTIIAQQSVERGPATEAWLL